MPSPCVESVLFALPSTEDSPCQLSGAGSSSRRKLEEANSHQRAVRDGKWGKWKKVWPVSNTVVCHCLSGSFPLPKGTRAHRQLPCVALSV